MKVKRLVFPLLLTAAAPALVRRAVARPAPVRPVTGSTSSPQDGERRHSACPRKPSPATRGAERGVRTRSAYDAIDAYVKKEMRRLKIPGVALAVVEGDRIVHVRGFGRARPGGEPPAPDTLFPIASLTKSFTALAVMQLVEAGKIELDALVQRYLPWFRVADAQASAQMTVRHLLNQTSGLPTSAGETAEDDSDDSPGATERQARALSTLVPARPPGAAFEYSNPNYHLLGLIIEAASGESYADYVRKHIFSPLGMHHTYTSAAEADPNDLAVGYRYWFAHPFAAPNMKVPPGMLPGGGLISSAEDIAHWLIAHLNGGRHGDVQILSGAGIDELHRGVADVSAYGLALGQYGMGWWVGKIGPNKLVWHGGTLPEFGAHMALLPELKKGVVLLFNACNHWMNPVLADLGTGVAALLAGEEPTPTPFFHLVPWALRGQLLIPVLQIAGVAATLRQLRRPGDGRGRLLLPWMASLLPAITLKPLLGKRRGYLRQYMPDYSWMAMVCGGLALVWGLVSGGLVLRGLRGTRR